MGQIKITPQGQELLADELARTYQEQLEAGINKEGNPLPPGIDLRETGAMLRSIKGVVQNGEIYAEVGVPYARFVLPRFSADGLAPKYLEILQRRWEPILAVHAYWQE